MRKNSYLFYNYGIWIFILFFISSCSYIDLSNWSGEIKLNQSLVVPIGEDSINVTNLLQALNLTDKLTPNADSIDFVTNFVREFQFNDIDLLKNASQKDIFIPLPATAINANTIFPLTGTSSTIDLGLNPTSTTNRFDSIKIATASIGLSITATDIKVQSSGAAISPTDLKLTLTFPKIRSVNGTYPYVISNISVDQFDQFKIIPINNVVIKTIGETGIPFQYELKSGTRNIVSGSSANLNVSMTFNQLTYLAAYGFFQPVASSPTTIKIPLDMLKAIPTGLRFENPKAYINVESNIGSYLTFNILGVSAFTKDHSRSVNALFNGFTSVPVTIDVKPAIPGLIVTKELQPLDRNWGTTNKLFDTDARFDTLEYKFMVQNTGNLSNPPDFIVPGMKMKANVRVQIPFYLQAGSNFTYSDSIPNVDGSVFTKFENANLLITATNRLPIKLKFNLKFYDKNNSSIPYEINDSINSGNVGNDGIVTSETISNPIISVSSTEAAILQDTKTIRFSVTIAGEDKNKAIQLLKSNYFKLKIGIFGKAAYSTDIKQNN